MTEQEFIIRAGSLDQSAIPELIVGVLKYMLSCLNIPICYGLLWSKIQETVDNA